MPKSVRNSSKPARDRARALRSKSGQTERLLWSRLRRGAIGFRFRRQVPIDRYVVDFYCLAARLAVEIDGEFHDQAPRLARDIERDAALRARGILVARYRTVEVLESMDAVLEQIHALCRPRTTGEPPP